MDAPVDEDDGLTAVLEVGGGNFQILDGAAFKGGGGRDKGHQIGVTCCDIV